MSNKRFNNQENVNSDKINVSVSSLHNEEKSKEEMARIIAKNMNADRRSRKVDYSFYNNIYQVKKIEKKRKKLKLVTTLVFALVLSFVAAFYLYGMISTKNKFLPNTYINGEDVGGKTLNQVRNLIIQSDDIGIPDKVTLIKIDGSEVNISVNNIGYTDNIRSSLSDFYDKQNHYLWFASLFSKEEFEFFPQYSFDNKKLDNQIQQKIIDASSDSVPKNAAIEKSDDEFVIVKEQQGAKIDSSKEYKLFDYIHQNIFNGESTIDLSEIDCYVKPKITAEQLEKTCQKLNSLNQIELSFDFDYTKEILKGEVVADWITLDNLKADEVFKVDEDKAMKYVEELADKYDTYGKDRTFKSTSRGTITVSAGKGCYGWWIDQQKTCDAIVEAVKKCESAEIEPVYYVNPYSQYEYTCNPEWRTEETDIGNTYMEVDLKKQHFWYYKNGKLKYECDIVSGMPTEERNTPEGVYKLWFKQKDRVLRGSLSNGETWETPVTFWNNISTIGVGLHDATWHPYFGGDRYKEYGSHGCINMPYDAAKYVYDNIPIGTPCVMYW